MTDNPEFITYLDEEGQRHIFHAAGTHIFRDGTFWCPNCGHRPLSPKHRELLARYIENAEHETYQTEVVR